MTCGHRHETVCPQCEAEALRSGVSVYLKELKAHVRGCKVCAHNIAGCRLGSGLREMVDVLSKLASEGGGA